MEKVTKQEIEVIALNILNDIEDRSYDLETISIENSKIKLYPIKDEGYYEQEGWVFNINVENEDYVMYFLYNGTPQCLVSFYNDPTISETPRRRFIIKNENDTYEYISKENYYLHHNFNFEKDFERKEFDF